MHTDAAKAKDLKPITPILKKISNIENINSCGWNECLDGSISPINDDICFNHLDPVQYEMFLDESGLGLPHRCY